MNFCIPSLQRYYNYPFTCIVLFYCTGVHEPSITSSMGGEESRLSTSRTPFRHTRGGTAGRRFSAPVIYGKINTGKLYVWRVTLNKLVAHISHRTLYCVVLLCRCSILHYYIANTADSPCWILHYTVAFCITLCCIALRWITPALRYCILQGQVCVMHYIIVHYTYVIEPNLDRDLLLTRTFKNIASRHMCF